jgi:hypothetical protein
MFNSSILDVAIGVTLTFLAVSLAASAITEAISSKLLKRENTLLQGVKDLLNDPDFTGMARDLYNHALVNPLASGAATSIQTLTHKPAYIDSRQFATALYNMFSQGETDPARVIETIPDAQIRRAMQALWATSANDIDAFKNNIAVWFDNSMDRVAGVYKRWTQWVSFLVALAIAVILNVNVLYEGARIWTRPATIADLSSNHFEKDADLLRQGEAHPAATNGAGSNQPSQEPERIFNALESEFLIGWDDGPKPKRSFGSLALAISSWLIVAAATLFGASFWFDMLQRLTHLRGTGLSPERSDTPSTGTLA